jgi:lambda family phage portal protein
MEKNFIDRFVSFLNPVLGAQRSRARLLDAHFNDQLKKLDAGSRSRRTAGWKTSNTGPNAEVADSISTIRSRARDLFYNNADAYKAITVIVSNVIGTGIRPSYYLSPENSGSAKGKKTKKVLNTRWKNVFEKTTIDFNEKLNIYGIQKQVFNTIALSGSCIVRVRRNSKGFPFAFQVFEPDLLDHSKDHYSLQGGGIIHKGVEFDKDGKVVAYWLYDTNPFDNVTLSNYQSTRIPIKDKAGIINIMHIFDQVRPGQVDGLPFGIQAFLTIRDLDIYEDAELVKQQVSACLAGFIYDNSSDQATAGLTRDPNTGNLLDKLEPGSIEVLPPGKDIKFSNPPSKEGFPEYVKTVKRKIAASYGVTYEALTGDLSNANFSSLKAGNNEFKKLVVGWQDNIMITDFLSKVWNIFLLGCELEGLIKIADYQDPSNDYPVSWTPPSLSMVDPTKEIPALIKMVRAGLASWQDVQRQLGNDPEETIAELLADNEAFDKAGLKLDSDPRADPNRVSANAPPPK